MRCPSCQNYVPSGLADGTLCPTCGKSLTAVPEPSGPTTSVLEEEPSVSTAASIPFAPYFTIRTALALGESTPAAGSLSFGPDGFSVVADDGRKLEKFMYRNLRLPNLHDRAVVLDLDGSKKNVTFSSGKRAEAFVELLSRVRDGLSAEELAKFKSRLEK